MGFMLTLSSAWALQCPDLPPTRNTYSEVQTGEGVSAIRHKITFSRTFAFSKDVQEEIYSKYPKADQLVLNMTFVSLICQSLLEDRTISPAQFREHLEVFREKIFRSPTKYRPVFQPPSVERELHFAQEAEPPGATARAQSRTVNPRDEFAQTFINAPPPVITAQNRYFVIVASPTQNEAEQVLSNFRTRFRELDFALYPPYKGNPHYAVMLATWVSEDQAKQALRRGLERGLPHDSYIWRCPGSGNSC